MKIRAVLLRLSGFVVALLFAVGMFAQVESPDFNLGGGADGGGNCYKCEGVAYSDGSSSLSCGSPYPGEWGQQYCVIESYENQRVCAIGGWSCCVD